MNWLKITTSNIDSWFDLNTLIFKCNFIIAIEGDLLVDTGSFIQQMCPLIGDRYKCIDCSEKIGFDLCEGCYNNSSNVPGKFNQQHKPDHKFVVIELVILPAEDDAPANPEDQTVVGTSPNSSDTQWDPEGDVAGPVPTNDTSGDHEHEGTGPTS